MTVDVKLTQLLFDKRLVTHAEHFPPFALACRVSVDNEPTGTKVEKVKRCEPGLRFSSDSDFLSWTGVVVTAPGSVSCWVLLTALRPGFLGQTSSACLLFKEAPRHRQSAEAQDDLHVCK